MQWGDLSFTSSPVSDFMGGDEGIGKKYLHLRRPLSKVSVNSGPS
jgi:hypothetical protein